MLSLCLPECCTLILGEYRYVKFFNSAGKLSCKSLTRNLLFKQHPPKGGLDLQLNFFFFSFFFFTAWAVAGGIGLAVHLEHSSYIELFQFFFFPFHLFISHTFESNRFSKQL